MLNIKESPRGVGTQSWINAVTEAAARDWVRDQEFIRERYRVDALDAYLQQLEKDGDVEPVFDCADLDRYPQWAAFWATFTGAWDAAVSDIEGPRLIASSPW